ncbi:hypothetical protein BLOT_010674 [Blomia tropicalis]|nr:hypothetical protein BLOT_010674 [Blomia tropicalis]
MQSLSLMFCLILFVSLVEITFANELTDTYPTNIGQQHSRDDSSDMLKIVDSANKWKRGVNMINLGRKMMCQIDHRFNDPTKRFYQQPKLNYNLLLDYIKSNGIISDGYSED